MSEYRVCNGCGRRFEVTPGEKQYQCPRCGSLDVRRP